MTTTKPLAETSPSPTEAEQLAELRLLRAQNVELQARLVASEGWFAGLIENMADGLLVFDHLAEGDYRIAYANRQAGLIFGRPAEQLAGFDFLDLVHPEDRERIAGRKHAASLGVDGGQETYRALHADGHEIWLTSRSGAVSHTPASPHRTRTVTSLRDVTQEHASEAALAEARARIDHILQIVPGVFYQVAVHPDQSVRVTFVSESVVDMFGVSQEEAIQPGFLIQRAQIDLASARWAALEKAGDKGMANLTYPVILRGEQRWLHDTLRWMHRPNGARDIVGFVTDATAEHHAEIEMRRMNWALAAYSRSLSVILRSGPLDELMMRVCESIVEEAPYILACFAVPDSGPDRPIRFIAKAGSVTEYLDRIHVSWSADDPDGHGPTGRAMREGVPQIMQDTWTDAGYMRWRAMGDRYGIRSSVTVPCWSDGQVVGAVLVYAAEPNVFGPNEIALFQRLSDEIAFAIGLERDRLRLREAHAARQQAEDTLGASVQLGPGLLYQARVRPQQVEILGVFGDPLRIAHVTDGDTDASATLLHVLGQPGNIAAILAMADDSTHSEDCAITAADGALHWLRNAVRITVRNGDAVDVVGYVAEVTEEKQQQLQSQQVTTLLTLGEMATGMAHELNQPLFSIILAAENAVTRLERQPQAVGDVSIKLQKIISESHRASKLIDHMRVFARNERGEKQAVSWHEALASAVEILHGKAREVQIINNLPADLPKVLGWPISMEQILINLIGNAVDAYEHINQGKSPEECWSQPKPVTISASVLNDQVALRVQDAAGGIAPDVLARMFEPFFTTKPVGKGTGLGLSIATDAVQSMGGTISASNSDGGALFEVRLAIAPPHMLP
ncbi:MAG: PAS domain S-box protein [Acetobacteraceae bacterium]|nr:PAS domain S-box protein [Acetobacteraceae bacterium]